MSTPTNMVSGPQSAPKEDIRKRQVSFGTTIALYEDGSTSEEETKEIDGPNLETMVFGQVVSGYILGHYACSDGFRGIYEDSLIANKSDEWIAGVETIIAGIEETGSQPLYYRDYKIKCVHLPRLRDLLKILRLANLEVRYAKLLAYSQTQDIPCMTTPLPSHKVEEPPLQLVLVGDAMQ